MESLQISDQKFALQTKSTAELEELKREIEGILGARRLGDVKKDILKSIPASLIEVKPWLEKLEIKSANETELDDDYDDQSRTECNPDIEIELEVEELLVNIIFSSQHVDIGEDEVTFLITVMEKSRIDFSIEVLTKTSEKENEDEIAFFDLSTVRDDDAVKKWSIIGRFIPLTRSKFAEFMDFILEKLCPNSYWPDLAEYLGDKVE